MNKSILLILSLALSLGACNRKPQANFKLSNGSPDAGDEILFINASVNAEAFNWDFGDGFTSLQQHPKHTYETSGWYDINLKVYGKKQKKKDSLTYRLYVDKTTEQKIATNWTYDSTATYYYIDGEFSSHASTDMAELYNIHTASFYENGTYTTTLDGIVYNGEWSVLLNDYSFLMDDDISYIEHLSGSGFSFFVVHEFSGTGGESLIDTSYVYLSL